MATTYWERTPQYLEATVSGGSVTELAETARRMAEECIRWHGTSEELSWRIDGDRVVFSFRGTSTSVGWAPDAA